MFSADRPFILLDDARASGAAPARLYRDPVAVIRADRVEELEACLEQVAAARAEGLHAAGYLSYEAGLALEARLADRLPERQPAPLLWFGLFRDYESLSPEQLADRLPSGDGAWLGGLRPTISREAYDHAFQKVQNYILSGDIYQANLTFRAEMDFSGHPLALFAAIRGRAQAGYGGGETARGKSDDRRPAAQRPVAGRRAGQRCGAGAVSCRKLSDDPPDDLDGDRAAAGRS